MLFDLFRAAIIDFLDLPQVLHIKLITHLSLDDVSCVKGVDHQRFHIIFI